MLRVMWSSRSSMNAMQDKLDNISNNIANVNTTGYKSLKTNFSDLVYESMKHTGYAVRQGNSAVTDPNSVTVDPYNGTGVKVSSTIRDNAQGTLMQSGVNTDLAIDGTGFFKVNVPDSKNGTAIAYKRNGEFNADSAGNLVDDMGNTLDIKFTGERFNFTKDNFIVDENGKVTTRDTNKEVGNINVYDVVGENSFISVGNNLYVPAKDGENIFVNDKAGIIQGAKELSNVDIGKEMTDMILTQRAFELSSKALKTGDEMYGMINNLRGR